MATNTHSIDYELSSSQYSKRADTASLSITGDLTIEAWLKFEQLPSVAGSSFSIVSKYLQTGNQRSYQLLINTSNKLVFIYDPLGTATSATQIQSNSALSVTAGAWFHLAFTLDVSASTGITYLNTSSVATSTTAGSATSIYDGTAGFVVGAQEATTGVYSSYFDGKMNNLRLWNDIRTSGEIAANWKTVLTNTGTANLVDSWYYTNSHNSASGSNDLTAVNTPVFDTDIPFGLSGGNATFFNGGGLAVA